MRMWSTMFIKIFQSLLPFVYTDLCKDTAPPFIGLSWLKEKITIKKCCILWLTILQPIISPKPMLLKRSSFTTLPWARKCKANWLLSWTPQSICPLNLISNLKRILINWLAQSRVTNDIWCTKFYSAVFWGPCISFWRSRSAATAWIIGEQCSLRHLAILQNINKHWRFNSWIIDNHWK